ncbi:MAG: FAD-dependent oxidoreductase, partial [Xanthobacteraceae bacterium]
MNRRPRVVIIGAGVIGLGIGWRLAGRADVIIFDRGKTGRGATHAAAGMLAACCEAEPGEEALVALGRESQARWPGFTEELKRASGIDVELRSEGTLLLALTADDQAEIAHRLEFQRQLSLPLEWLSAADTRRREPRLAGKIAGAVFSPQDHQVDNRKLAAALRVTAEAAGVKIVEDRPVKDIVAQGGRVKGVAFEDGVLE